MAWSVRSNAVASSRVCFCVVLASLLLAPVAYRIVDLGLPPGAKEVRATAINNRDEVLVASPVHDIGPPDARGVAPWANGRAYLWRAGRLIDFGEPDGSDMLPDPLTTEPTALNDRSVAVGTEGTGGAIFGSGRVWVYPFVWRGRGMIRLAPGQTAIPRAINVRGDIVGGDNIRGWAMLDGKVWGIDTFSHAPAGNRSGAVAVNAHRQILGTSTYGGTPGEVDFGLPTRPFTVDGSRLPLRMVPVPVPKGCGEAEGLALNNAGTILASAFHRRGEKNLTYLVRHGRIVPLPFGNVMNGWDEVVGGSPLAVWREGRVTRLPTFVGWKLQTATGINDKGAICGTGLHEGKTRAFVLVPRWGG